MSITLPPDIEAFVEREVSTGEFASRDELIVAAVELMRRRKTDLAQLRAEIEKGMEGEGIPAEQAFAMLRARFAAPAENRTP
jgi:putative addiction module CopG family antidote